MNQLDDKLKAYPKLIHINGFDFRVISSRDVDEVEAYMYAMYHYQTCCLANDGESNMIDIICKDNPITSRL